jgi:hypothetical protein
MNLAAPFSILSIFGLTLLFSTTSPAAPKRTIASQRTNALQRTSILNSKVSFQLPPRFRAMTRAEIARKFPTAQPPQYAWTNSPRISSTIAVSQAKIPLTPAQLPQFKTLMERYLTSAQRDVRWQKREIISFQGRKWVHFEFTAKAVDTRVWNDMYFTSFQNQMLAINFNTVLVQKNTLRPIFMRVRNSLRLRS